MKKLNPKSVLLPAAFLILLLISAYQTYALASLSSDLSENGISFGGAKPGYSFSANSSGNLSELPDMAGGC